MNVNVNIFYVLLISCVNRKKIPIIFASWRDWLTVLICKLPSVGPSNYLFTFLLLLYCFKITIQFLIIDLRKLVMVTLLTL